MLVRMKLNCAHLNDDGRNVTIDLNDQKTVTGRGYKGTVTVKETKT
jgi:hypothetical protein